MPKITIDNREVEVPPRATILDAARKLRIDVPTLCFLEGCSPSTSCLVCTVKLRGGNRLVPSCATEAVDGMEVDSETPEVHDVRQTALELLLSDHVGDCFAPCYFACPAHMDIPVMLRQIAGRNPQDAIVTVKRDIALPAVLGRVCPKPCEKGCRRAPADAAVAICALKRYVADADLESANPYLPECKPASNKRVVIVGAGPTGLSAAFYLLQQGHAVTILDNRGKPGGRLLEQVGQAEGQVPQKVLDGEIGVILRLGAELRLKTSVDLETSLADLRDQFDAVLIARGAIEKDDIQRLGLMASTRGIQVDQKTYQTKLENVFAAGNAIRTKAFVVRSVADGKEVALAMGQYLAGEPVTGPTKQFSVRMGRLGSEEVSQFMELANPATRQDPPSSNHDFSPEQAVEQAGRCLHCDCRKLNTCRLKHYAVIYGADVSRYRGQRAQFHQVTQHSRMIYEPGKCINCGLCIELAAKAEEPLGLTFIGRGFNVRVGVPFDRSLEEALGKVACECVAACPTAALSLKDETCESELPAVE